MNLLGRRPFYEVPLSAFNDLALFKMQTLNPDECWEWSPCFKRLNTYAKFRKHLVHRMSCHLYSESPVSDTEFALHSCDHPWCWNPRHLRAGKWADNAADRGRVHEAVWV